MKFNIGVTAAMVKAEAARRIEVHYPLWKQMNMMREHGSFAADEMVTFIDRIRRASNRIEAMKPIPPDFAADHHWN
jgi:hypothetical protein